MGFVFSLYSIKVFLIPFSQFCRDEKLSWTTTEVVISGNSILSNVIFLFQWEIFLPGHKNWGHFVPENLRFYSCFYSPGLVAEDYIKTD